MSTCIKYVGKVSTVFAQVLLVIEIFLAIGIQKSSRAGKTKDFSENRFFDFFDFFIISTFTNKKFIKLAIFLSFIQFFFLLKKTFSLSFNPTFIDF